MGKKITDKQQRSKNDNNCHDNTSKNEIITQTKYPYKW